RGAMQTAPGIASAVLKERRRPACQCRTPTGDRPAACPAFNRKIRCRADVIGRTADVPDAKLREIARGATARVRITDLQMLEIAFFRRVARRIHFAVQIEAEAAVSVALKRDMRRSLGRRGPRPDN